MNFLITGGYGYLGSQCAEYLSNNGHYVRILSHRKIPDMGEWGNKFDNFYADITNPNQLKDSCNNIDIVIHFAAINEIRCANSAEESILINGLGTKNLLDEAVSQRVKKFIYISTFHVYGATKSHIISEKTCPEPIHNYGISHYLAELFCNQYKIKNNLGTIILRLSNGYGAPLFPSINRWSLVVNEFCKEAVENKKITLKTSGIQKRDFVSIKDILQAISIVVKTEDKKLGDGLFNVGANNALSILEIAQIVAIEYEKIFGEKLTVDFAPNLKEVTQNIDFIFNIDKISSLGYSPSAEISSEIKDTILFCMKNKGRMP